MSEYKENRVTKGLTSTVKASRLRVACITQTERKRAGPTEGCYLTSRTLALVLPSSILRENLTIVKIYRLI